MDSGRLCGQGNKWEIRGDFVRDYDVLLSKYNIAIAKAQDLQEQLQTKQQQWEKRDETFAVVEKLTRELCEDILAKKPEEMVLGKDYSWSKIPVTELVNKSKGVLKEYSERQISIMEKMRDITEARRLENEDLKDTINRMDYENGEISRKAIEAKKAKEEAEKKAKENMDWRQQKALNAGKINIGDEDSPFDNEFDKIMAGELGDPIQTNPRAPKVYPNRKKFERKKEKKKEQEKQQENGESQGRPKKSAKTPSIDFEAYDKKLTTIELAVVNIIGSTGISATQEIKDEYNRTQPCEGIIKPYTFSNLKTSGVVSSDSVKGLGFTVYSLTKTGKALYKNKSGKDAVESEAEKVLKEHSSYTHGYGIKKVAQILEMDKNNKEVIWLNGRKKIETNSGSYWIPDIICTHETGKKSYYEYETGHTNQTDFNAKCNKMTQVTDTLNFLAPNGTVVDALKDQVSKWVKNRGIGSLRSITVRITSKEQIEGRDLAKNQNWKVVFLLNKSEDPKINF